MTSGVAGIHPIMPEYSKLSHGKVDLANLVEFSENWKSYQTMLQNIHHQLEAMISTKAPVMQYTPTSFHHQRKTIKQERQECNTGSAANTVCWTILFMQLFVAYIKQKSKVMKWFQDVHYADVT